MLKDAIAAYSRRLHSRAFSRLVTETISGNRTAIWKSFSRAPLHDFEVTGWRGPRDSRGSRGCRTSQRCGSTSSAMRRTANRPQSRCCERNTCYSYGPSASVSVFWIFEVRPRRASQKFIRRRVRNVIKREGKASREIDQNENTQLFPSVPHCLLYIAENLP